MEAGFTKLVYKGIILSGKAKLAHYGVLLKMQELGENKIVIENLHRAACPKCQKPLGNAEIYTVSQAPASLIAHATCANCKTASMITVTTAGTGLTPITSDLGGMEFKKFMSANAISFEEILGLHKTLKEKSIWKLLQRKEI